MALIHLLSLSNFFEVFFFFLGSKQCIWQKEFVASKCKLSFYSCLFLSHEQGEAHCISAVKGEKKNERLSRFTNNDHGNYRSWESRQDNLDSFGQHQPKWTE